MKLVLAIGAGGFIGGMLRYLLSTFINTQATASFPLGTLAVNIIGCFLIGMVFGIFDKGGISQEWKLFLATGILGGFTTFSAFSMDTFSLLKNGFVFNALLYVLASLLLGILATYLAYYIIK